MAVIDRRSPGVSRTAVLVGGDLLAFFVFAAIGRGSHGMATGIAAVGEVALTAAGFAASWLVVAPLLGVYRAELAARPLATLGRTALAWLVAWPFGLLLWSALRQRPIQLSFALVTFVAVLVILGGWRTAYAWLARRREAAK